MLVLVRAEVVRAGVLALPIVLILDTAEKPITDKHAIIAFLIGAKIATFAVGLTVFVVQLVVLILTHHQCVRFERTSGQLLACSVTLPVVAHTTIDWL